MNFDQIGGFEKIRKTEKKPARQDSKRIDKAERKKVKQERKQRKMDTQLMEMCF